MIVPGLQSFSAYIGSTFDTVITVYPSTDANFNWTGAWTSGVTYNIGDVAIGSDSNAYESTKGNLNKNPVGDVTGSWSATPVTPSNLNGYVGIINIVPSASNEYTAVPILATPLVIQGTQGTMKIKFTPTQTGTMTPGALHHYIVLTSPNGDQYYYLTGTFSWLSP